MFLLQQCHFSYFFIWNHLLWLLLLKWKILCYFIVLIANYQGNMMLMPKQCPIECFLLSQSLVLLWLFNLFFPPYTFFRLDEAAVKVEDGRSMQHHVPWDMESVLHTLVVTQLWQLMSPCHFPGWSCVWCHVISKLSNSLMIIMCLSAPFDPSMQWTFLWLCLSLYEYFFSCHSKEQNSASKQSLRVLKYPTWCISQGKFL